MALWQVDIAFIPPGTEVAYGQDGYEVACFGSDIAHSVEVELSDYLGPRKEALKGWLVYGDEKGSRIDLHFEERGVEICGRIDASNPMPLIELILRISRKLGCKIYVVESRVVLEPSIQNLLGTVSNSRAASFVSNPRLFLEKVARES